MKFLITVIILSICSLSFASNEKGVKKEAETKRVCIKILDNKTNKEVEKCRNMKVREKHEGTKVPK